MKVVINKCHGGFGLSREAFLMLREMGNRLALEEPDIGEYWPGTKDIRENWLDHFGDDIPRDDLQLIEVIETLGDRANTNCSELTIVEIPDDTEWQVDEYDGMEWIAEKHRTWE